MAEVETNLGTTPEGQKVDSTSVKILKLGDGLSAAVKVEPVMVHAGDVVYIAVRAKKVKDQFDYAFDDDGEVEGVTLIQVFNAQSATFVDEGAVRQAIARSDAKIAAAKVTPGQGTLLDPDICTVCGEPRGSDLSCDEGSPLHSYPTADDFAHD